jgi:hypothetical protein
MLYDMSLLLLAACTAHSNCQRAAAQCHLLDHLEGWCTGLHHHQPKLTVLWSLILLLLLLLRVLLLLLLACMGAGCSSSAS